MSDTDTGYAICGSTGSGKAFLRQMIVTRLILAGGTVEVDQDSGVVLLHSPPDCPDFDFSALFH